MNLFFLIARVVRTGYKALRAAAGIVIVAHAMYRWACARASDTPQRKRRVAAA